MSVLGGLLGELGAILTKRVRRTAHHLYARLRWGRDLPALASYFGTDKWGSHWYARHYQRHFAPLRRKRLRILEIGVGGYGAPAQGGESLRMWKAYFPNAQIYGMDLADKRLHNESRVTTVVGSQDDGAFLRRLSETAGPFDIVVDDGSHVNAHIIKSFQVLFPLLSENGIYVIEDTQTAYWPAYGGSRRSDLAAPTSMNFLKVLADGLNYREFVRKPGEPRSVPSYFDEHIVALHFYHNLVFVQKGLNDEQSNVLADPA